MSLNNIDLLVKKILTPYKFRLIKKEIKRNKLIVLDVGCGARACEITKMSIDTKRFDGIDKNYWHGDKKSYEGIDNFYQIDLETETLDKITNEFYDVIVVSHLIEHIRNGEQVIKELCKKLKIGGVIYIETPSLKTINLPSGEGFSNFYDDHTHIRIYSPMEILKTLNFSEMKILKFGIRRDLTRIILLSPFAIIFNIFYYLPFKRRFYAKGLWDLLGIAQFWFAKRVS